MRRFAFAVALTAVAIAACAALAPTVQAAEIDWVPTLKKGIEEAKRSGRSVLYVTLWKPGT